MGEVMPLTGYKMPLSKTSSVRNWLYLVKSLTKRAAQIWQDIANGVGHTPQLDAKAPLLKTSLIFVIDCGEIELIFN